MLRDVFLGTTKLVPEKNEDGKDKVEEVSFDKRFEEMKNLLEVGFNFCSDFVKKFQKNDLTRFKNANRDWSKNKRSDMKQFYEHFSASNFKNLDVESKELHSNEGACVGCNTAVNQYFSALWPVL